MASTILFVSYFSAAIAFLTLGILLLAGLKERYRGLLLVFSCLTTAVWAATVAFGDEHDMVLTLNMETIEVVRGALWMFFFWEIILGAKATTGTGVVPRWDPVRMGLVVFALSQCVLIIYVHTRPAPLDPSVFMTDLFSHVLQSIAGMVLVEQLFRNTHPDARWGIKFMCLGIGVLFSYDFFMYADAFLFQHINPTLWLARGLVVAFTAPLILVSAGRNPRWAMRIRMSRQLAFHTVALLGTGSYLLVMSAMGYYIRAFGGAWGTVLQIVFFMGALILLATIFFSGRMRAKLRVTLSKHFFGYKYDYREEWMRFTRTLLSSEPNSEIQEAAIQAIAALVESPSGTLWLEKESGQGYVCQARWATRGSTVTVPVDDALIRFMARSQWVVNLDQYPQDIQEGLPAKPPGWLMAMETPWLVVPLLLYDHLMGFIVLSQPRSDIQFNWEVSDLLKAAAHQLTSHLAQKRATDALMVARQFDSFNRMSAFVVHDLKNLVAQLSLMLSNAERHKDNPEFQADMLATVDNSVKRMKRLLAHISNQDNRSPLKMRTPLKRLLEEVLREKAVYKPAPRLEVTRDVEVEADPERLTRILGHVVQNACEATPFDGQVVLRLSTEDNRVLIEVEDTGEGMDEAFVKERLFKPFDSTKSSGMGIGAHECREYVNELGGEVEVKSVRGKGTLFMVWLPVAA